MNIDHIKQCYYSIKALNPTGIVPVGPDLPGLNRVTLRHASPGLELVPELQRRGVYKGTYRPGTLREKLGVPRLVPPYIAANFRVGR